MNTSLIKTNLRILLILLIRHTVVNIVLGRAHIFSFLLQSIFYFNDKRIHLRLSHVREHRRKRWVFDWIINIDLNFKYYFCYIISLGNKGPHCVHLIYHRRLSTLCYDLTGSVRMLLLVIMKFHFWSKSITQYWAANLNLSIESHNSFSNPFLWGQHFWVYDVRKEILIVSYIGHNIKDCIWRIMNDLCPFFLMLTIVRIIRGDFTQQTCYKWSSRGKSCSIFEITRTINILTPFRCCYPYATKPRACVCLCVCTRVRACLYGRNRDFALVISPLSSQIH